MLSDEATLIAQSQSHEPGVADDDGLQAQQLAEINGAPASLADGPPPALDAVLRRTFSLNGVTRPGVVQKQKRSSAGQKVSGDGGHRGVCALDEIHRSELVQGLRPENQGAE